MTKEKMINVIFAHYYAIIAEYRALNNTMDWENDTDTDYYYSLEEKILNMEILMRELELSFTGLFGKMYENGEEIN